MICYVTITIISVCVGIIVTSICKNHEYDRYIKKYDSTIIKLTNFNLFYNLWLRLWDKDYPVKSFLRKKGEHRVIIYGMGELGVSLWNELKYSDIHVEYAIDLNKSKIEKGLEIFHTLEFLPEERDVLVIITAVSAYTQIARNLKIVGFNRVIGIDELLYDCYEDMTIE